MKTANRYSLTRAHVSEMHVGDLVEFRSDLQTEKGPSSGSIVGMVRIGDGPTAIQIRHSDAIETFEAKDLIIERRTVSASGRPLWLLK